MNTRPRLGRFLDLSAEMTGFTVFDLRGTGLAECYLSTVERIVGAPLVEQLLTLYEGIPGSPGQPSPARTEQIRKTLLGEEKLGPIARNLIKLWYIGIWFELPREWNERFGAIPQNTSFMVSALAYIEGLLWPAVRAHPPGAKAPGYGSWSDPP